MAVVSAAECCREGLAVGSPQDGFLPPLPPQNQALSSQGGGQQQLRSTSSRLGISISSQHPYELLVKRELCWGFYRRQTELKAVL